MGVMDRYNKKKQQGTSASGTTSNGVMQRYERNKYYNSLDTSVVNDSYINSFISDSDKFVVDAQDSFKNLGWSNASSSYDTVSNTWKDLKTRQDIITAWLRKNRNVLSDEKRNSIIKSLDNSSMSGYSVISKYENALNEYSQFASEDEYNQWVDYQKWFKNDIDTDGASQGWNQYIVDDEKERNENIGGKEDEKWYETLGRYLSGSTADTSLPMGTTTYAIEGLRADKEGYQSYRRPKQDWTEEQRNKFGELYLESPELAFVFGEETNKINAAVKEKESIKAIQDSATSSFGAGAGHTVGAIVSAPFGLADFLSDLTYANAGYEIPKADGQITPFEYSQAVTGGIASHLNTEYGTLDEDIPIIGGAGWGDAYGLGTSIAQSALSAYTLGPGGTLVSYFGQGAAAGVDDALARGATDEQALIYGMALGVFEAVAEEIGVDNLFKLGSSATIKGVIKNILMQAGAEGAEEGLTSLFSNIADNVIMQDKSNFNALVAQYMAQGMSESEAQLKAWMDSVEGIAYDTISGAISGGVHAGPQTAIQTVKANKNASKIYGSSTADLVTESLEIDPNNKYAQKMQNRLSDGKKLSGGQINRLIDANETTMRSQDVSAIKKAASERLTQLGEKGNVEAIAKALTTVSAWQMSLIQRISAPDSILQLGQNRSAQTE